MRDIAGVVAANVEPQSHRHPEERAPCARLEGRTRARVAHPSRLAVKDGEHLRMTARFLAPPFINIKILNPYPGNDEQPRVPDAVQRFFSGAPQSRDRHEHRRSVRPRLCSAPRREEP
jgi:hypothetical protein